MGFDLDAAREGMGRDLEELISGPLSGWFGTTFLVMFFVLPVAALLLLVFRRWLALLPLLVWLAYVALWFLYYAIGLFAPIDNGGGLAGLTFLLLIAGWGVLLVTAARLLRRDRAAISSDPR